MKYEKVSDPTYKFEFNGQEATTLSDIMNAVIREFNRTNAFTASEFDLAGDILSAFDDSEL